MGIDMDPHAIQQRHCHPQRTRPPSSTMRRASYIFFSYPVICDAPVYDNARAKGVRYYYHLSPDTQDTRETEHSQQTNKRRTKVHHRLPHALELRPLRRPLRLVARPVPAAASRPAAVGALLLLLLVRALNEPIRSVRVITRCLEPPSHPPTKQNGPRPHTHPKHQGMPTHTTRVRTRAADGAGMSGQTTTSTGRRLRWMAGAPEPMVAMPVCLVWSALCGVGWCVGGLSIHGADGCGRLGSDAASDDAKWAGVARSDFLIAHRSPDLGQASALRTPGTICHGVGSRVWMAGRHGRTAGSAACLLVWPLLGGGSDGR